MKLNCETEIIENLAKRIMTAARTAPKGKGLDTMQMGIVEKSDLGPILSEMKKLFDETGRELFSRDAKNLEDSDACILFSVVNEAMGLNCGACGFDCAGLQANKNMKTEHFNGPMCAFITMNLGISLGSACKVAMELCVDNRLMYSVGLAAKHAGVIEGDIVIALPLSIKGKNIYFDRKK